MTKQWLALYVRQDCDLEVAAYVNTLEHAEAVSPVRKFWRKVSRHVAKKIGCSRKMVEEAVIAGYVLVSCSSTKSFDLIMDHGDVFGFVGTKSSDKPSYAPDDEVQTFLRWCDLGCQTEEQTLHERSAGRPMKSFIGRFMEIATGPNAGQVGEAIDYEEGAFDLRVGSAYINVQPKELILLDD